jgi:hypothetical protein
MSFPINAWYAVFAAKGQRFALRLFRPFPADLAIKKSSIFFPPLIASTSQRGFAPRPAQVSPDGLLYFGGTFVPFNELPPTRTILAPPTTAILSQLLFNLSPTLEKGFINLLSQVHERLNGHP